MWLPVPWALNMVNRSMGRDDLYPFVLPNRCWSKSGSSNNVIDAVTSEPPTPNVASSGR
jgi:hypothetical protein